MSAINSIAFLVIFIADDDKYTQVILKLYDKSVIFRLPRVIFFSCIQCEELLFTGLQDASASVTEFTAHTLLPVLAKWALDIDKLESHLISRLLSTLEMQIKVCQLSRSFELETVFKTGFVFVSRRLLFNTSQNLDRHSDQRCSGKPSARGH